MNDNEPLDGMKLWGWEIVSKPFAPNNDNEPLIRMGSPEDWQRWVEMIVKAENMNPGLSIPCPECKYPCPLDDWKTDPDRLYFICPQCRHKIKLTRKGIG